MVTSPMNIAPEPPNRHCVSPPPCSAEDSQHPNLSKDSTDNLNHDRCEFRFSDRRRCRMQRASFCLHHAIKSEREPAPNGFPDGALEGLQALCSDLTTATNINRALAQTYLLLAQGRISQK